MSNQAPRVSWRSSEAGPGAAPAEGDAMTWDETVKRLEGARLNYVAAVWRGAGFDPEIAEELDDIAAALRAQGCDEAVKPEPSGWENLDGENAEYVNRVTAVVREADRVFERVGGGSRHWVRDCFLPLLNRAGLRIGPVPDVVCRHGVAMDVHCCHCHSGFIFDMDHECPEAQP